jgi:hypothetical protein
MKQEEKTPLLITAILHGFCIINAADELGNEYIKQETKQSLNRFIQTFMRAHKHQIALMFNTQTDHSENRGDALIEGQTIVELLGKQIGSMPYHTYPDLINLIEGYKNGTVVLEKEFEKK